MNDDINTMDLFIFAEEQAKAEAMAQVEANNTPAPLDRAYADAVAKLPSLPPLVSVDTIVPDISIYDFTDGRALGPLMVRLMKERYLDKTDQHRKSVRKGNHRVPRQLYRNLLNQP